MFGLYGAFAKVAFLTQLEYRGQYFMRMIAKLLGWSSGFILLVILLKKVGPVAGWGLYEILLLYAFDVLSYSIAGTFFMGGFGKLPRLIRSGELDGILTKPVNPLIYLICTKISAGYTSNYVIAGAMIGISLHKLGVSLSLYQMIWLILDIAGASLIQAAGFMITTVPAFWFLKSDGLYRLFYRNLTSFLQYPLTIYHGGIRFLLTFLLPYGFINFYPVQLFINRQEGMPSPVFLFLTPFVGAFVFFIAYRFWNKGLNAYQSTGS